MSNFGKNLTYLRYEKGIKLKHIAQKVGVSPNEVSRWGFGLVEPKIDTAYKVAKILGTTLDQMVSEDFENGKREED